MSINFKHVGIKQYEQRTVDTEERTVIPYGIKTPLRFSEDSEGGFLEMNFTVGEQIKDNLRNLLLTNHGERVGRYFYGANLNPLAFEYTTKIDFDNEAAERIKTAVEKWMPFIELYDMNTKVDYYNNKDTGKIDITVTYSVPRIGLNKQAIKVTIYVI